MRLLALIHALAKMAAVGHLYSCEPVWTWRPGDGMEPTEESVACGRSDEPVSGRPGQYMTWYAITCTPKGCWP